jgi:hypothetical protein
MSADDVMLSHRPLAHRERAMPLGLAFGLLAGPLAWFGQLCIGYGMSSWPCFPKDQHLLRPVSGFGWTGVTIDIITIVALAISLMAILVSWRLLPRTLAQSAAAQRPLVEVGTERMRFLALWGMMSGSGFAIAIVFTGIAYFILPRCAG